MSPVNAATNVPTHKRIIATFNKGMNPATLNPSTFTVRQGTTDVSGTVTWSAATNTATFTPASPLGLSRTYTATLSTGAQDASSCSTAPMILRIDTRFIKQQLPTIHLLTYG